MLTALLASACQKPPAHAPARPTESAGEEPASSGSGTMWHHFWDVAVARDALIEGDIEVARITLLRLAREEREDSLPVDWERWVGDMRAEAQKAEHAKGLRDMAAVLTAVSAQCAECHRTTRGGPAVKVDSIDYGQHRQRGLEGVMARHAWAADELWVGMTVPNYSSWIAGARALGEFPLPDMAAPPDGGLATAADGSEIDPALRAQLEAVRALGKRAEDAGKPFEQIALYTDLLVLCGDCHQAREKKLGLR